MAKQRPGEGKKILLIIGFIILLLGGWVAFGILNTKYYYVTSDDEKLELDIPKDALPEGVNPKDITIRKKEQGDREVKYELSPQGLRLKKPAIIYFSDQADKNTLPIAYHLFEDTVETIKDQKVNLYQQNNRVSITGTIDHFSYVIFGRGYFSLDITDPDDQVVGERFKVEIKIKNLVNELLREKNILPYDTRLVSSTKLEQGALREKAEILSPHTFIGVPELGYLNDFQTYSLQEEFKCYKPGETSLEYEIIVRIDEELISHDRKSSQRPPIIPGVFRATITTKPFKCVTDKTKTTKTSKSEDEFTYPGVNLDFTGASSGQNIVSPTIAPTTFTRRSPPTQTKTMKGFPPASSTSDFNKMSMQMLVNDGKEYPLFQFGLDGDTSECPTPHYNVSVPGKSVYTLDFQPKNDPDPTGCGFGKQGTVTIKKVIVNRQQQEEFVKKIEQLWGLK